jgi:hypothetical protein
MFVSSVGNNSWSIIEARVNRPVNYQLTNIILVTHTLRMPSRKNIVPLLLGKKPRVLKKHEFINHITSVMKKGEISWLATDTYSFEWAEINLEKKKFVEKLTSLEFKMAHVGVFYSDDKRTEYETFHIHK